MAPHFNRSQFNSALRKAKSAANDLDRQNRKLKVVSRDLDRRNSRARRELRRVSVARPTLPPAEREFLDSVAAEVAHDTAQREHDVFVSHASADLMLARELHDELTELGAAVWIDDVSIRLGQNIVRAIDLGIASARVGVVLVTPIVLEGRPWVEREFSALLNSKDRVIPVLYGVSWSDLQQFSPLLHLNKGISTTDMSVAEIAALIAGTLVEPAP